MTGGEDNIDAVAGEAFVRVRFCGRAGLGLTLTAAFCCRHEDGTIGETNLDTSF